MVLENVLVIGRDREVQSLAGKIGKTIFAADSTAEAIGMACNEQIHLAVFDYRFSNKEISAFIKSVSKNAPDKILFVDNQDSNNKADDLISAGADYYLKDINDSDELDYILKQIEKNFTPKNNNSKSKIQTEKYFIDELCESANMVGQSTSAQHTLRMIKIVSQSQCNPILITGETGTGKEIAAKAIHNHRHANKPFIAINCAALTANLLESELFGHVKGSFTSADSNKVGLLEMAEDGSIFLDEISEMPLELQAKLLRVVQEKTFRKVGGTKEIQCKATIIASSNRNLKIESEANKFRPDLYHRLSIFPVALSPLRKEQRKNDIKLLAEYFLITSDICPEKIGKIKALTPMALETLSEYNWPGNIRELKNVIDRAIMLENKDKIGLSSIVINTEEPHHFADDTRIESIKDFSLSKAEQKLIGKALKEANWQKTRAAEMLGISRATLYAKVKQHGICDGPEKNSKSVSSDIEEHAVA